MAWCGYGFLLLGRHDKARDVVVEAKRLDPLHLPTIDWILGQVHFFHKQYDQVAQVLNGEALLNSLADAFLVAAYAHSGRLAEAKSALASFISHRREEFASRGLVSGGESLSALAGGFKQMWRSNEDWEHLVSGLKLAGMPD